MEAGETSRPDLPQPTARPAGRSAIYSVELEVFEGPLDLLLHLVRRHELEILDIPIAFITEKYLAYLDLMRSLDLEIAGDYLVMAATLAWLKSRELLPTIAGPSDAAAEDDEDGEDPREALIRRLVEYERFKNAAADLDALPVSGRDVFARGSDIDVPPIDPGLAPVTLFRLAEAYYRVLTRAKINKSHDVQLELVTVAQRMTQLTLMLEEKQGFDFEALFFGRTWTSERELRTMLVVTLMSILELVKLGVAGVQQVPDSESIRIYRLVVTEEARALIEHYDEAESFGDAGQPSKPLTPLPTEAELDAAEESVLLAEALAGADDTDLGPDAGSSPAANSPRAAADEPALATHHDASAEPDADAPDTDDEASDEADQPEVDTKHEASDEPDETAADTDHDASAEPDADAPDTDDEASDEDDPPEVDTKHEASDEPDETAADTHREGSAEPDQADPDTIHEASIESAEPEAVTTDATRHGAPIDAAELAELAELEAALAALDAEEAAARAAAEAAPDATLEPVDLNTAHGEDAQATDSESASEADTPAANEPGQEDEA